MHTANGHGTAQTLDAPASFSPIVVEAQGLCKTYFGKMAVPVLHDINLQIRAGTLVAIVGQSGSGKSTLLHILGALDVPTAGRVLINGVDIATLHEDELARLRSEEIGFIFQFHHLLDELTCLENALLPIIIQQGVETEEQRARVIRLLQRVRLGPHLHKRPDEMSGGQNQRCAIVRALANTPKIVLADEPTGNLDSRSGTEVFTVMREMHRESGVACIIITHDDRLAQAADRVLLLEDGVLRELEKGRCQRNHPDLLWRQQRGESGTTSDSFCP
jgi:lipoprotein-releasing system ATP-binding protein